MMVVDQTHDLYPELMRRYQRDGGRRFEFRGETWQVVKDNSEIRFALVGSPGPFNYYEDSRSGRGIP